MALSITILILLFFLYLANRDPEDEEEIYK